MKRVPYEEMVAQFTRVLEKKGFLLVDSGATYLDGTTDITRTYPLGELTEDEKLFYTWTLQCHIDIAKAVWLNYCDGHMLDTIAREPLWQHLINYLSLIHISEPTRPY